ncbi:DUF4180 domain-containing protein [Anaerocolumna xylanovorans]|uniref:DUF4180 domain-containing protein n=1 Tax=Anaerocolumna xylanovorans DSM 12503 TaxID=1121345 RepID=A0A1M7XWN7_9FIRM|nr:DUF4180 domain-containing protein [Anaerocolumna xylanovorans]SHO43069.1 protein of unknown function [Anaerocolumna xylanovorans DSM 12503]
MNIKTLEKNNILIAIVQSDEVIITDVQSALDFMMSINYETGCNHIALDKAAVTEEFFKLSSCLAGEILQKFINYHVKFAIIGEFSHYTSKPLKDLIYESNHGKDVFFVSTEEEAIEKLSSI